MKPPIIEEIMNLKDQPLETLKKRYSELFPGQTTPSSNKVFIWRRIAHKLQEQAYGALSEASEGRIQTLIAQYDPVNNKALRPGNLPAITDDKAKKKRDMRLPIPGTVITKEYKGQTIEIRVLDGEFEYKGKAYRTLTSIAKEVTGAHWNGFLFFNL